MSDCVPGFRRRIRIQPAPGCVVSELEDDYHRMRVTLYHDGETASRVDAVLVRAPWSTCPSSVTRCEETFTGVALRAFADSRAKASNCTHLFDLALLGAEHALDDAPLVYDVFVSDPVDGRRHAGILLNGATVLDWIDADYAIVEPREIAGTSLHALGAWIAGLDPALREPARILRWASLIAHGRIIPMHRQSDASRMPPTCYTFQPERAATAKRIGEIRDFSDDPSRLLAGEGDTPPVIAVSSA